MRSGLICFFFPCKLSSFRLVLGLQKNCRHDRVCAYPWLRFPDCHHHVSPPCPGHSSLSSHSLAWSSPPAHHPASSASWSQAGFSDRPLCAVILTPETLRGLCPRPDTGSLMVAVPGARLWAHCTWPSLHRLPQTVVVLFLQGFFQIPNSCCLLDFSLLFGKEGCN